MKSRLRQPLLHLAFAVIVSAVVLAKPLLLSPDDAPEGDAPRYIAMGLNLAEHGVISGSFAGTDRAPKPGLGSGGPLVAFELAAITRLDSGTRESFICALTGPPPGESCPVRLGGMKLAHWIEIVVFGGALWWTAWLLSGRPLVAWVALGLALTNRELATNAQQALTEPLLLAFLGLFMVAWIRAWQSWRWPDWSAAGLLLGLLVLTKPAFAAAGLASVVLLGGAAILRWCGWRTAILSALALGTGTAMVLAPWLARSIAVVGAPEISDPAYFDTAFAHRVAYNAMSWREWLVGWIYYLPDFGDSLAAKWFPRELYEHLGWGDAGYYVYGRDVLYRQAAQAAGPGNIGSYLIAKYALADPIKHGAVSLLLAWRGLFVGKIWGLVGLLALVPAIALLRGRPRRLFVLLTLLAGAMLLAQSLVSVSIPRYNLALIPVFSIAAATVIAALFDKAAMRWRRDAATQGTTPRR